MNLSKLFEAQKVVRKKIIETNGLEGQDLVQNLILALRVELGEMANEQRSWKHWSKDRKPRITKLLEEYADCLSFTLELALELGIEAEANIEEILIPYSARKNITKMFNQVYLSISDLEININYHYARKNAVLSEFNGLLTNLITLGILLGFDYEQIEAAYFNKNAINLKRQEEGY
ncbi:dUTP diphosphatase [Bacillus sp. ISL-34]|uniref:dUTP diphosphatase n=1 Tax=Bacillus sp. ISL-34 TaxID=2819121 RepID=UPI001BE54E14|nr:dUTP diphosphatase [Bacillus sp. ISL-34]MBT2647238.1 dUTP diphosphatase [Bacillus sp. ISL-34]